MTRNEEQAAKDDLEQFAKTSVSAPVTIADWVEHANESYPMQLRAVAASEIKRGVNMYNLDEGCDIATALQQSRSPTLSQDIGAVVLSPSRKDPTGAHTQINKAISIADFGEERSALLNRIRKDWASVSEDRELLKGFLTEHGLWHEAFADRKTNVDAINATIALGLSKRNGRDIGAGSAAYLWHAHIGGGGQHLPRPRT